MGYFDKMEDESLAARKVAEVTYLCNGGKQAAFNRYWPLKASGKEADRKVLTKEMWETIKKTHNIK